MCQQLPGAERLAAWIVYCENTKLCLVFGSEAIRGTINTNLVKAFAMRQTN